MTWTELIATLREHDLLRSASDVDAAVTIGGVAYDSRHVTAGELFVALRGQRADGAVFAEQAIGRGAVGIVSESPAPADVRVPWATVQDGRQALARIANRFFGDPSRLLQIVGITGTNGKTTTSYLVASIFEAAGLPCGLIGTVGYSVGGETREATRTTPEAPELQQLLRSMVDNGCRACAMEVSSHALALHRVTGMAFGAAIFTNLTRDHLDFHEDMDAYFRAKRRLFEMLPKDAPGIINVDDPRGAQLVDMAGRPVTYAINRPADVKPGPLTFSLTGLTFDVRTPQGTVQVHSSLVGRPNVYNILAAVATATALGLPIDVIEAGLATLVGVPGRFEIVSSPSDDVTAVVDYAHTDDALRNLLETARPLAAGRLITVFGCGGDRDRSKRPLMGAVAGRLSDVVVITSDNPRSEDPLRIIEEIKRGMTGTPRDSQQQILQVIDRKEAIATAIDMARPGDLVLLAGKGHEKYQVLGTTQLPFDDVAAVREALARRRSNSGVV